jgi:hypothetical protein
MGVLQTLICDLLFDLLSREFFNFKELPSRDHLNVFLDAVALKINFVKPSFLSVDLRQIRVASPFACFQLIAIKSLGHDFSSQLVPAG